MQASDDEPREAGPGGSGSPPPGSPPAGSPPAGSPPPAPIAPVPGAAPAPPAPVYGGAPVYGPASGYGTASGARMAPGYTAPPGWTPPPKPGLVPLRPLSFGEIFSASFAALRTNPRTTVLLALPVQFAASLLLFGVSWSITAWTADRLSNPGSPDDVGALLAGSLGLSVLALIATWIITGVVSQLLQGLLVADISREVLGEKPTIGTVFAIVRGRLGALVGWALLYLLAALVLVVVTVLLVVLFASVGGVGVATAGALLLGAGIVVLLVWVTTKLAVVPSAIVVERLPLRRAVVRSWQLTRGRFWMTFGTQFVVSLLIGVVGSIISTPITLIAGFATTTFDPTTAIQNVAQPLLWVSIASAVVSFLVSVVSAVALASCIGVLYTDLRMRRDGLDLELVHAVEARAAGRETPDPFLTEQSLPRP